MALVDLWFLRAETLDLRYSVKRPVDLIYGMVGQRELAEDLTQETFVKAFRALDRHGPERKPSAWILRIANNTAIDYVRRKRPDSTRSPLTMTPGQLQVSARPVRLLGDTPTPNHDLREADAALKRAVRRLRPQYRRCFVLRHIEERSYDEIARIMNVSVGTVGTYLHRAREQLKRMLQPAAGISTSPSRWLERSVRRVIGQSTAFRTEIGTYWQPKDPRGGDRPGQ